MDGAEGARRRHGVLAVAQVAAVALVVALLGLLVWRVLHGSEGGALVAASVENDRRHPRSSFP